MFGQHGFLMGSASSAAPINPATLFGGTKIGAWIDATDAATVWSNAAGTTSATVGGVVGKVSDKGTGPYFAAQTDASGLQPIYRQAADGKRYLDFDGVDDYLRFEGATATNTLTTISTGVTFLAVISLPSFVGGNWLWGVSNLSNRSTGLWVHTTGQLQARFAAGTNTVIDGYPTAPIAQRMIVGALVPPAPTGNVSYPMKTRMNDVSYLNEWVRDSSTSTGAHTLGRAQTAGPPLHVYEALVFRSDTALSASEIAGVEAFWRAKYGVPK